jgi:hypothetical protein
MSVTFSYSLDGAITDEGDLVDREHVENVLMEVTGETLPRMARDGDYPVQWDHCFRRIAYDVACDGVWYDHVDGRPAYQSMTDAQLISATAVALGMLSMGPEMVEWANEKSLYWRGGIDEDELEHHEGAEYI